MLTFVFSYQTLADDSEIKGLMNNYLKALHSQDKTMLKNITSKEYYISLNKNFLQKKVAQKNKFISFGFDIKINKAKIDTNQFWVNIKDKKQSEYSEYWYIIEEKKNQFKIIDMIHSED